MKKNKIYVVILLILVCIICIIGVLLYFNKDKIINALNIKKQPESIEQFTYSIYDNVDSDNIRFLVQFTNENGLEYVKCPNDSIIYGNGKTFLSIDYTGKKDETLIFISKEKDKDEKQNILKLDDETIKENVVDIKNTSAITGIKEFNVTKKLSLEGFDVLQYKFGDDAYQDYEGPIYENDYYFKKNNYVDEDNNITMTIKIANLKNKSSVVVEQKFKMEYSGIEATSLMEAIKSNDLDDGVHLINVEDEGYTVHTYTLNGNQEFSTDKIFGTAEDVSPGYDYARNMIVLKVNGDLTIDKNVTLTTYASNLGYGGPKGLLIYCTGKLTNNGTINMSARGAKARGQNIFMWKGTNRSYECVPAYTNTVLTEFNVSNVVRKTGNGGRGGRNSYNTGCDGALGTSYSGGSGGRRF